MAVSAPFSSFCAIHFNSTDSSEELHKFSNISWDRVVTVCELLSKCDGGNQEVAVRFLDNRIESNAGDGLFFHRSCYQKLTNKNRLLAAEKRRSSTNACSTVSSKHSVCHSERMTRSTTNTTSLQSVSSRNQYVLPPLCIICRREKFTRNNVKGTYVKEKLVQCETDGRALLKSAESKKDTTLLLHIKNVDMVAAEVRYHRSCYRNYTRDIVHVNSDVKPFNKSFDDFCTNVIEKEIHGSKVSLCMNTLFKRFAQFAEKYSVDISSYTKQKLKSKLLKRYPDLSFLKGKRKNDSELVFFDVNALAKKVCCGLDTNSSEKSSSDDDSLNAMQVCDDAFQNDDQRTRAELYFSSLYLKQCIRSSPAPLNEKWPTTANDLCDETARQMIPPVWESVKQLANSMDQLFWLSKLPEVQTQKLPSWTGFNTAVHMETVPQKSKVGYMPIIDSSPTNMSTVYAILQRSIDVANELELQHVVVVFDQAIYSKAQEIRWQNEEFQQRLVLRLGEFHTCMAFLAVIGKRFRDVGLADLLIKSEVVAEGSINGVLNGHFYNRSVRCYKLLADALARMQWQEFLSSLSLEEHALAFELALKLNESFPLTFKENALKMDANDLLHKFQQHQQLKSSESPMYALWNTFISMVQTLQLFIRATRMGDFHMHLAGVKEMLPWFFCYDHINYARYLSVYLSEMVQLEHTHPDVFSHLCQGQFVVQQQDGHSFAQTACDQVIEQTVNRDSKSKGGLCGVTQKKGAMHRWLFAHLPRAQITSACLDMAGREIRKRSAKDLDEARLESDESAVINLMQAIESMFNPFSFPGNNLINISTGAVASSEIKNDYIQAREKGEISFQAFWKERIVSSEKDLFAPLTKLKLKKLSDMTQKKTDKSKVQKKSLQDSRSLLTRLLISSRIQNIDLKMVLKHSLSEFPLSIANVDGSMARTDKSKLGAYLIKNNESSMQITIIKADVMIIDAMALLHQQLNIPTTFGGLAQNMLHQVVCFAVRHELKRVDFVSDTYPEYTIKGEEQERRSSVQCQEFQITGPEQQTPCQFRKFLMVGKNKQNLVEFLFHHWCVLRAELANLELYITVGSKCFQINSSTWTEVPDLCCDHEEADTRMLLHAKHASNLMNSIVIKTPDTDVLVLAVALSAHINADLFLIMGSAKAVKNVCVSSVYQQMGAQLSSALLGLHVFTGCDTISCFKNKGKMKALNILTSNPNFPAAFSELGSSWSISENLFLQLEKFVCILYGEQECVNVDDARYNMFFRDGKFDEALPPTHDCIVQHIRRSNYQAAILRKSLESNIEAPSPTEHGWQLHDDHLVPVWMNMLAIPDNIMISVTCKCQKNKCLSIRCSCQRAGLACSELCNCNGCSNSNKSLSTIPDLSESDSDDSDV